MKELRATPKTMKNELNELLSMSFSYQILPLLSSRSGGGAGREPTTSMPINKDFDGTL